MAASADGATEVVVGPEAGPVGDLGDREGRVLKELGPARRRYFERERVGVAPGVAADDRAGGLAGDATGFVGMHNNMVEAGLALHIKCRHSIERVVQRRTCEAIKQGTMRPIARAMALASRTHFPRSDSTPPLCQSCFTRCPG